MNPNRAQWLSIGGVILVCIVIALFFFCSKSVLPTVTIGEKKWTVEVARTEEERSRGLGYRERLSPSCGMLFLFDQSGEHRFWMKGMRFPLDILFISNGEVLSVERNIDPGDPRIFSPPAPVNFVLEVNAGEADTVVSGMEVLGLPQ